jgi:hypothetical protein
MTAIDTNILFYAHERKMRIAANLIALSTMACCYGR